MVTLNKVNIRPEGSKVRARGTLTSYREYMHMSASRAPARAIAICGSC